MRGMGLMPGASLGLILLCSPASAASFDCAKAIASDEKAVCANSRLSDLDSVMGQAYAEAKTKAERGERVKLQSDTRAFMARRHACGTDDACLTSAYVGAIEDFRNYDSTVEVPPSVSALDMIAAVPLETRALPSQEGDCAVTHIDVFSGRLEGDPHFESGTAVSFGNGGAQVSYDKIDGIIHSHRGDRVLMCLTSIPKHCPPGDDRGRMYTTTNLRTHATWSLPDSQHACGGA